MRSTIYPRNQSLDVLRCIAILLVLGGHAPYYRLWSRVSWIGVDLFFVLSGFLISGLLFRDYLMSGSINFARFFWRRGFKIWPSYYIVLAVVSSLYLATHRAVPVRSLLVACSFLQNYFFMKPYLTPLVQIWSLSVEEHFYLFLPLLFMALIRTRKSTDPFNAIPWLFVAMAAVCLVLRWVFPSVYALPTRTDLRIDSLFAGVLLGYLHHFRPAWFHKLTGHYALVLAALLCAPAAFFDLSHRAMQTVGITGLMVGFVFLVAWSVVRSPKSSVGMGLSRIAAKIGFYSYSIYLWHVFVSPLFVPYEVNAVRFWAYIAGSIYLGMAMAHLIELPFLALREKIFRADPRSNRSAGDTAETAVVAGLSD